MPRFSADQVTIAKALLSRPKTLGELRDELSLPANALAEGLDALVRERMVESRGPRFALAGQVDQLLEERGAKKQKVEVAAGGSSTPFLLRDDTGAVMVDPQGADIDCLKTSSMGSGWLRDPPIHVKELLKAYNLSFEGFLGINKTMQYKESWLPTNLNLYVLGNAGDNPYVEEDSQEQGFADVMIGKGGGQFLISKESEQEMLSGLSGTMWFGLVGGPILIAVCPWLSASPYVG